MILPQSLTSALEIAVNHYLSLDDETLPQLVAFEGKIIAIEILVLNQTLFLFPSAEGIMILSDYDGEANTTISGTPLALAKLGIYKDASAAFFAGEVRVSGNIRLGHQFKNVLQHMQIDWEEHLSRFIGDIAAHQLSNTARELYKWMQRSTGSFNMNVGEYLQEESQLVVSKAELDRFAQNVDELRSAVDRIESRLNRLR